MKSLTDKKYNVTLDRKDLAYKGNIAEFERRIGKGHCIITIISDRYLKSDHCMNEMLHIERKEEVFSRIFPIVLDDARGIYKPAGRLAYQAHWKKGIDEFKQAIDQHGVEAGLEHTMEDLTKWESIRIITGKIVKKYFQ